jgi:hypothetical protein
VGIPEGGLAPACAPSTSPLALRMGQGMPAADVDTGRGGGEPGPPACHAAMPRPQPPHRNAWAEGRGGEDIAGEEGGARTVEVGWGANAAGEGWGANTAGEGGGAALPSVKVDGQVRYSHAPRAGCVETPEYAQASAVRGGHAGGMGSAHLLCASDSQALGALLAVAKRAETDRAQTCHDTRGGRGDTFVEGVNIEGGDANTARGGGGPSVLPGCVGGGGGAASPYRPKATADIAAAPSAPTHSAPPSSSLAAVPGTSALASVASPPPPVRLSPDRLPLSQRFVNITPAGAVSGLGTAVAWAATWSVNLCGITRWTMVSSQVRRLRRKLSPPHSEGVARKHSRQDTGGGATWLVNLCGMTRWILVPSQV